MKKLLVTMVALVASGASLGQQVTLVCKGWMPMYENLADRPVNEISNNDSFVIEINKAKHTATYLTQIGEIVTNYEDSTRFYSGRTKLELQAHGKFITGIDFSLDRMTGRASIIYSFRDEKNGKIIFSGDCAPGKPIF